MEYRIYNETSLDTEIASKEPLSQTRKQEILEAPLASNHQDSKSQGLLQPISPRLLSLPKHKESVFEEVYSSRERTKPSLRWHRNITAWLIQRS